MRDSVAPASPKPILPWLALGLVALAIIAIIVLRVSGTAFAPLWLGATRGDWAVRALLAGLALLAGAAIDWWMDRQARLARARALGRDA